MSKDPFIEYLKALPALAKHATGQMAAYRRACAQRLAESRGCQDFAAVSARSADFLTITLVAQYSSDKIEAGMHHRDYPSQGSIGAAWAAYCKKRKRDEDPHTFYQARQRALAEGRTTANIPSIHERFRTLLDAELELDGTGELAYRLRGLVRMLVSEDIPIDVIQLAHDLREWRSENRHVQERWAKAFYAPAYARSERAAESGEVPAEDSDREGNEEDEDNVD